MNEIKRSTPNQTESRIRFWGTLTLSAITLLVYGYFFVFLLRQPKTPVIYIGVTIYLLSFVSAVTSMVLTIRQRQELGSKLGFYTLFVMGITMISVLQGRAQTATLTILVISIIEITWLLPRGSRRWYYGATAVAILTMWVIEWINPPWRVVISAATVGPVAFILFGLVMVLIVVRQVWDSTSLLWKMALLTGLFILSMIGTAVGAYVGIQNLRYQLTNIYDFMLVPIVAINHADASLADAELHILQSQNAAINTASRVNELKSTVADNQTAKDVLDQYNNEWVTTVSPEFTQALRDAGLLNVQQQEVDALSTLNSSMTAYQAAFDQYSAGSQAGQLDPNLATKALDDLKIARAHLQELIDINSKYADFSNNTARSAAQRAVANNFWVLAIATIASLAASYFIIISITKRVSDLTRSATAMQSGNLDQNVTVTGRDEISLLGTVFNEMAARLKNLFGTLEQRVADRTRNLELAAEVGRAISQVRDLNSMLKDACELILKEFDLYYVQVYLSDPSQSKLKLEAGTGTVGALLLERGHSLPFDANSINGRAALDQRTVVIADTSQSATFRKNPLLPETRGEMAVPLIVANKVVGVLDMQSNKADVLTEEVLPAFEALAGQLAVAIQNSNLLTEAEQARAEVEKQARRLVRKGWNEHLDAIHKPEKLGFVFDNNEIITLTETTEPRLAEDEKAVAAPISVTGEALGSLVVEFDDESRRDQTNELVTLVARQVAQQIESLRLLESAERYRSESEQAARRQTIEGWQEYMASKSTENLGYVYDTKEVLPHDDQMETSFELAIPLKARDEMIGKLGVQGVNNDDQEAVELVNAVAERLSAHIENLRLFEETRLSQIELDKRAQQLASVAEITTVSSREFDVQKMLESVVHLTQRKFGLYHCHVFLYNEQTNMLKIAACGWKEGDIHEGTHGTAEISLDQEQSLVARAARSQKAVIANDVHNERGWLPNPLLPDTAAELAVPLFIGDRLLGVLDVQSDHVDAFSDEDANIQTTLASQVATALQNANSFNQAQSALTQSERLFDASRRLTQATDLQHLVAETVTLMNIPEVNRALLTIFDYEQTGEVDQLTIIGNWWNNTGHEITPIGTRYPREIIRAMTMFVSPVPVFFNDAFIDERVDATTMQLVKRLNLRAVAVLPLHLGAQQIGALILEAEDPHDFTQDEIRLFSALAPQIATVVENKRQFEKAQRQAERESMLNAIGQKIQSATSVEAVLQIAARELGRALSAPLTVAQLGMATKPAGSNGNGA